MNRISYDVSALEQYLHAPRDWGHTHIRLRATDGVHSVFYWVDSNLEGLFEGINCHQVLGTCQFSLRGGSRETIIRRAKRFLKERIDLKRTSR